MLLELCKEETLFPGSPGFALSLFLGSFLQAGIDSPTEAVDALLLEVFMARLDGVSAQPGLAAGVRAPGRGVSS